MRAQFFTFFFVLAGIMLIISSCKKTEEYPIEPNISFNNIYKISSGTNVDNYGMLILNFTDGDGDIGLSETDVNPPFDTTSIYYYNFFINYYEKQHGIFVKPTLFETFNARIPILNTSNGEQPLKGTISIQVPINNFASTYDTIKFDCQICDRALHLSNKITSPELIIKKH
ncbi:MAG: hypothetical protein WCP69_08680 [Bacteroidota bacterium]